MTNFTKTEKHLIFFLLFIFILGFTLKTTKFQENAKDYKKYQKIDDKFEKLASIYEKKTSEKKIININKASEEELEELSGIGEKIAKRIVEYRKKNGKFIKIEEIKKIKGIGEKKFNNIKNLITVEE